ncbi:MAG TPA: ATP-binding protein [Anaeromyxobacteraceae bacterium]|nr:ATP-binding protein [Anaeromyxobacteraceae bacterium]
MRARIRLLLVLHATATAAAAGAVLLAGGAPLLAARALGARSFALLAAVAVLAVAAVGVLVLFRGVARPLERLLSAAERLGAPEGGLPPLGPPDDGGGSALMRAALAFERVSAALADDRARLAEKVAELGAANERLEAAREELLRAERLATVGRLASGIAHEVGNPLGAIAGYADLARDRIRDGRPAAEVEDFLGRIAAEAQRIDAIVRDLLAFARPPAPAPTLAAVELTAAVDAAVRLARVQGRLRDVEVRVDLGGGPRVLADERRLTQVILNLLLNAGDAVGGRGRVEVAARPVPGAPDRLALTVVDDGPGIAPAILPRIFDPFFTTKDPGRGTGLGLAVCHGIVESFGGDISAANGPRGGAVFRVVLRAPGPAGDRAGPC